jgi:hypothetical protein
MTGADDPVPCRAPGKKAQLIQKLQRARADYLEFVKTQSIDPLGYYSGLDVFELPMGTALSKSAGADAMNE